MMFTWQETKLSNRSGLEVIYEHTVLLSGKLKSAVRGLALLINRRSFFNSLLTIFLSPVIDKQINSHIELCHFELNNDARGKYLTNKIDASEYAILNDPTNTKTTVTTNVSPDKPL